ncbi:hypothetical protein DL93DRAFT_2171583 [Clavulina sp. PMI_390]|nr:hypothetical protein DL93DRAFT_2171583 [Clavulina sp. PMI_390]
MPATHPSPSSSAASVALLRMTGDFNRLNSVHFRPTGWEISFPGPGSGWRKLRSLSSLRRRTESLVPQFRWRILWLSTLACRLQVADVLATTLKQRAERVGIHLVTRFRSALPYLATRRWRRRFLDGRFVSSDYSSHGTVMIDQQHQGFSFRTPLAATISIATSSRPFSFIATVNLLCASGHSDPLYLDIVPGWLDADNLGNLA